MADMEKPMDSGIAEGIAMLEQILEVMPDDVDTLKALYGALIQCDRRDDAFAYLRRMAQALDESHDGDLVDFVVGELDGFEQEAPSEVTALLARIQTLAFSGSADQTDRARQPDAASGSEKDIGEELALAWRLYEESQLSQEEYSSVLHDLTETSSKHLEVPVSVLHVLNDRGFTQMNRILNYMSSRSNVPCLSLARFELSDEIAGALPLSILANEGALPFGFFGEDLLVAVLNPFNHVLLEKVEKAGGRRCHSYLVAPEEYDAALGKLREKMDKAA